jgi:2-haloacid dehalogenase
MTITTCVFDAYGTLFDVSAAAREAAAEPGQERLAEKWQEVAGHWRAKQLQYTWIRALARAHTDFWTVTTQALDWALEATELAGDQALKDRLLELYRELAAYPEVPDVLAALRSAGRHTAILSNGSPAMLDAAVHSAGIEDLLDTVLSVETVGVFKPNHRVYDLVGEHFGCPREEVLFVSSNGWDVAAAAGYGFRTLWANRNHEPVDRLPWTPEHVMDDLRDMPDIVEQG